MASFMWTLNQHEEIDIPSMLGLFIVEVTRRKHYKFPASLGLIRSLVFPTGDPASEDTGRSCSAMLCRGKACSAT
jgi:hypothetical protein